MAPIAPPTPAPTAPPTTPPTGPAIRLPSAAPSCAPRTMPWACPIWGIASSARAIAATATERLAGRPGDGLAILILFIRVPCVRPQWGAEMCNADVTKKLRSRDRFVGSDPALIQQNPAAVLIKPGQPLTMPATDRWNRNRIPGILSARGTAVAVKALQSRRCSQGLEAKGKDAFLPRCSHRSDAVCHRRSGECRHHYRQE